MLELPRIGLDLRSHFGRKAVPHDLPMLATVLVEPDDRRLSMVWQSALRVAAADADYLDETEIVEKSGALKP